MLFYLTVLALQLMEGTMLFYLTVLALQAYGLAGLQLVSIGCRPNRKRLPARPNSADP